MEGRKNHCYFCIVGVLLVVVSTKKDFFSVNKMWMKKATTVNEKIAAKTTVNYNNKSSCEWTPRPALEDDDGNYFDSCVRDLIDQILHAKKRDSEQQQQQVISRWLFFGDSTMGRLFRYGMYDRLLTKTPCSASELSSSEHFQSQSLHDEYYSCKVLRSERCNSSQVFGFEFDVNNWQSPQKGIEGPVAYGLKNPSCQDCLHCGANISKCILIHHDSNINSNNVITTTTQEGGGPMTACKGTARMIHPTGGYIGIEFARDVEIQTAQYNTTQENFAHYLEREWNTPELVRNLGRPVCVISTGHHDVKIPGISLKQYLNNVEFYLRLMEKQCSFIVWLANTSPLNDQYVQKVYKTNVWNHAVQDLLSERTSSSSFWKHSFFIDVYNASRSFDHDKNNTDNMHMSKEWYELLGGMFYKVVQGVIRNSNNKPLA